MDSVLKHVSKTDLKLEPFPHIVVDGALDADLYRQLAHEYPYESKIEGYSGYANNARYQLSAVDALREARVSSLWKEFIGHHISSDFFNEVCNLFEPALTKYYPNLEPGLTVGTRFIDRDVDIWMDCQPGMNSPVREVTSVKGPHLDNPSELFAGLLYFRHPDDDSMGGDLEIYRYRSSRYRYKPGRYIEEKHVEKTSSIRYAPNRLILFLNTIDSVHGVSPRQKTAYVRRLTNLIAESGQNDFFDIPQDSPLISLGKAAVRRALH